jgi:hypothetical protein
MKNIYLYVSCTIIFQKFQSACTFTSNESLNQKRYCGKVLLIVGLAYYFVAVFSFVVSIFNHTLFENRVLLFFCVLPTLWQHYYNHTFKPTFHLSGQQSVLLKDSLKGIAQLKSGYIPFSKINMRRFIFPRYFTPLNYAAYMMDTNSVKLLTSTILDLFMVAASRPKE